jgi:hypothetical protein
VLLETQKKTFKLGRGGGPTIRSTIGKEALDVTLERPVDRVVLPEAAEALARLLLHPVVAALLGAADPA